MLITLFLYSIFFDNSLLSQYFLSPVSFLLPAHIQKFFSNFLFSIHPGKVPSKKSTCPGSELFLFTKSIMNAFRSFSAFSLFLSWHYSHSADTGYLGIAADPFLPFRSVPYIPLPFFILLEDRTLLKKSFLLRLSSLQSHFFYTFFFCQLLNDLQTFLVQDTSDALPLISPPGTANSRVVCGLCG